VFVGEENREEHQQRQGICNAGIWLISSSLKLGVSITP
jgi:hypothetical protein